MYICKIIALETSNMKNSVLFGILLFLIGGNALYAQGVQIQINGNQSFVINEENGIYFHHDTITVGGEDFALDDITVITMQVASSGIENVEEDIVKLMPNPATNVVMVQGIGNELQTVAVYSLAGIKLL